MSKKPIRQYINMKRDASNERSEVSPLHAGRVIELFAKIDKKYAGQIVAFQIEPGPNNFVPPEDSPPPAQTADGEKRDGFDPFSGLPQEEVDDRGALLIGDNVSFEDAKVRKRKKWKSRSAKEKLEDESIVQYSRRRLMFAGLGAPARVVAHVRTNDKGVAKIDFWFSEFGGDVYTVKAFHIKKLRGKGTPKWTDKYEVWRRLYYQVSRFDNVSDSARGLIAGAVGDMKKEYEKSHIELVEEPAKKETVQGVKRLDYKLWRRKEVAGEVYDDTREPLNLHVIAVKQFGKGKMVKAQDLLVPKPRWIDVPLPDSIWDDGHEKPEHWIDMASLQVWTPDDNKLGELIYIKQYVEVLGPKLVRIHLGKLPETIRQFLKCDDKTLLALQAELEMKRPWLYVEIEYRAEVMSLLGLNHFNATWLTTETAEGKEPSANDVAATLIHEVGHAVGQVPPEQATHYAAGSFLAELQKSFGGHCAHPMKKMAGRPEASLTRQQRSRISGTDGDCVMWGTGVAGDDPQEFCSYCKRSLAAAHLRLDPIPTSWRR